jgi:hypothetical protein
MAMSLSDDPIGRRSRLFSKFMTAHPEKLLAIVVYHLRTGRSQNDAEGQYFEVPQSIAMTSINSNVCAQR